MPFVCQECNKDFADVYRRNRHMAVHSAKRIQCPFCRVYEHPRRDKLRNHIQLEHEENIDEFDAMRAKDFVYREVLGEANLPSGELCVSRESRAAASLRKNATWNDMPLLPPNTSLPDDIFATDENGALGTQVNPLLLSPKCSEERNTIMTSSFGGATKTMFKVLPSAFPAPNNYTNDGRTTFAADVDVFTSPTNLISSLTSTVVTSTPAANGSIPSANMGILSCKEMTLI